MPSKSRIAISSSLTYAFVGLLLCYEPILAQVRTQNANDPEAAQAYNPYPPGILPSNLESEVTRVLREIDVIENRALVRWHSLPQPVLAGQPPVLQNTGTESIETL